jgi:hypothetical protein
MEISIETSGLRLSHNEAQRVRKHVLQRIEDAFARIRQRVMRVTVHLEDISGTRGEPGRHCVVKVSLPGATALAQGSDRNPFALVNRVAACAADVTLKRIKRVKQLKRRRATAPVSTLPEPAIDDEIQYLRA